MDKPAPSARNAAPVTIGRYTVSSTVGSGGMATVHLASVTDNVGFVRAVAVKRLHPHHAEDPRFARMFLDEARLAMRVRHPHVVSTLEAVADGGEVFLVMDYVVGDSLAALQRAAHDSGRPIPPSIAVGIVVGALYGLHAAHEAMGESGEPLLIVHRDVSPQNILVGVDGLARVLDFGVAKAQGQKHSTEEGEIKGKLRYMAPEQLVGAAVDRRVDVFAAGIVLWESLAGRALFDGDNAGQILQTVLGQTIDPPSALATGIPAGLDEAVLRALSRRIEGRFATARDMAIALEAAIVPASLREIGEWVSEVAGARVRARAAEVLALETAASQASATAWRGPTTPPSRALGDDEVLSDAHEPGAHSTTVRDERLVVHAGASPPHRRGLARGWMAAALVGVLGVLTTVAALASGSLPRAGAVVPVDAALAAVAVESSTLAPPAPSLPSASATSAAAVSPAASASLAAHVSAAPRPRAAPRKPDCRNLFTVDSRGYRVPRPECF